MPTGPTSIQPDTSSPLAALLGFAPGASAPAASTFSDTLRSALGNTPPPAPPGGSPPTAPNSISPGPKREKDVKDLLQVPALGALPIVPSPVTETAQPLTAVPEANVTDARPLSKAAPAADPVSQSVSQP